MSLQAINTLLAACQKRQAERESRIATAQRDVLTIKHQVSLNDNSIQEFASKAQLEHAIAAISLLASVDFAIVESMFNL